MRGYTAKVPTLGDDLHRKAEAILGKREYTDAEYLEALTRAQAEAAVSGDVEALAVELLRDDPGLRNALPSRCSGTTSLLSTPSAEG